MAEKIIAASLKVDTGSSVQDINAVNKALDNTSQELKETDADAKQSASSFTNLKGALGQVPGPLGQVNQGITTVSTSLKALAANPIVLVITALVAALVALYKAFASTEEGAEKIEQIMSGLGAVIKVIRDRILAFAGAIVSFFKGDFAEAAEQAKAAVTGVGDAIVQAYTVAADATRRLQEAQDELNRTLNVDRAKLNRDLAATKELISDTTASYKERKNAIDAVRDAEAKQSAAELANAQKTLQALQDKYNLDQQDSDLADQIAEQKIRIYNIEQQSASDIRSLNRQSRTIEREQQAAAQEAYKKDAEERKRIRDQEAAEEKKRIDDLKTITQDWLKFVNEGISFRQKQTEDRKKQDEQDLKDREDYQKQIDEQERAAVDKHIKLYNANAEAEKKIDKQRLAARAAFVDATAAALNSLAELFGKQTIAGKALAIAGATIDTFRSAVAAFRGMVETFPGPWGIAAGVAAAAASVALGVKNIQQIVATKVPGESGSGSVPAAQDFAAAAPIAPQQQGTTIDQSSIQGIGDATSGRVYVLSQDVTHDQNRNERLNRAARLGG